MSRASGLLPLAKCWMLCPVLLSRVLLRSSLRSSSAGGARRAPAGAGGCAGAGGARCVAMTAGGGRASAAAATPETASCAVSRGESCAGPPACPSPPPPAGGGAACVETSLPIRFCCFFVFRADPRNLEVLMSSTKRFHDPVIPHYLFGHVADFRRRNTKFTGGELPAASKRPLAVLKNPVTAQTALVWLRHLPIQKLLRAQNRFWRFLPPKKQVWKFVHRPAGHARTAATGPTLRISREIWRRCF